MSDDRLRAVHEFAKALLDASRALYGADGTGEAFDPNIDFTVVEHVGMVTITLEDGRQGGPRWVYEYHAEDDDVRLRFEGSRDIETCPMFDTLTDARCVDLPAIGGLCKSHFADVLDKAGSDLHRLELQ